MLQNLKQNWSAMNEKGVVQNRIADGRKPDSLGLTLAFLYLFLEYVRIPFLNVLFLPMIVLIAMIVRLLWLPERLASSPLIALSFLLALYMALHIPFATNNYWAFQTTKMVLASTIAMSAIIAFTNNYRSLRKVFMLFSLILITLAVWGIAKDGRIPGSAFLGDENDFALAMNIAFPFVFFSFQNAKSLLFKAFCATALTLVVVAHSFSLSRGGLVGLIPTALFCWSKSRHKLSSLFMILLLVGAVIVFAPASFMSEMRSIGLEGERDTSHLRIYYWQCGLRMFLDNPVFGVGPGNFPWRISDYEPPGGMFDRMHGGRPAHSLYFTLIPELGIVGVILYGAMIWHIYRCRRFVLTTLGSSRELDVSPDKLGGRVTLRRMQFMLDGAFIAYFVTSVFLSTLYYPYFWTLMGLASSIKLVTECYSDQPRSLP